MREIRLRAKSEEDNDHVEKGDWVYGFYYFEYAYSQGFIVSRFSVESGGMGSGLVSVTVPVDFETRGLYTGIKDVWEGDILVEKHPYADDEYVGTVVYDEEFAAFVIQKTNGGWEYLGSFLLEHKGFVVGGNIHENPELLNHE